MISPDERDREEEALEALIVAAFRSDEREDVDTWTEVGPEPVLSDEDERAIEALGPDLVPRILSGEMPPRARDPLPEEILDPELAGAMNRSGKDSGLTEKAREEIERRIREREREREEGKDGEGRGD